MRAQGTCLPAGRTVSGWDVKPSDLAPRPAGRYGDARSVLADEGQSPDAGVLFEVRVQGGGLNALVSSQVAGLRVELENLRDVVTELTTRLAQLGDARPGVAGHTATAQALTAVGSDPAEGVVGVSAGEAEVRLKVLLCQRHWQTHRVFKREYDKVAGSVDPSLVGTWPSRAQFYRWLSGKVSRMPHSEPCRVLEAMFPDYTARELFEAGPVRPARLAS